MRSRLGALFVLFLLQVGCGMSGLDGEPGDDDDDDDFADGDADADADADADGDGDSDADGAEDNPQDCADEYDNDDDGLGDCDDPGCAALVECCDIPTVSLLDETFDDLNLGTWKPFGDGDVVVQDSALFPSGDDRDESGIVSNSTYPLVGVLEIHFTITVPSCEEAPCNELIGVALTPRNDYADASTVEPSAGVVIDKSTGQANALFVVNGAVERTAPIPGSAVDATLQILPDRRMRVLNEGAESWFESQGTVDAAVVDAYIAVFGRSGSSAGVGEVKVLTGACTLPSSVHRDTAAPVVAPGGAPFAASAARAPSVAQVPATQDLEMLFAGVTSGVPSIGHATSTDAGRTWITSPGETPVLTDADMPLGWTHPDDPALLIRDTGEHVAVVSAESLGDASQRSLVFATSADGLGWTVVGPPMAPPDACHSIRHPELDEPFPDELVLLFTCEDADGLTSIRRANGTDLGTWELDPNPVLVAEADPRELDGVAAPTLLVGDTWELWYEARSGTRRVLRYAVSSDGAVWERWEGTVLEPGPAGAWDDLQVAEPSAVVAPAGGELLLHYTGLGPNGQGIGLVTRALPGALPEL